VNTIEQARKDGCNTVVYATTSSIYGDRTEPSPESMDVEARTGYEASKLARERYAEYFHNFHGMSLAGMRFFSVYQGFGGAEEHKGASTQTRSPSSPTRSPAVNAQSCLATVHKHATSRTSTTSSVPVSSPPTTNSKASTTSARPRATPSTRWWR